ncbi:MAG: STAS-like domain-containing protein [Xanthomonadaceae bacterium]|nr:STAS-like domain-containing protein [Xanthomonadaceae bacterium]MDP2186579.1 STAS-like domain-containing protein [Xanthomonadales bacterium]MDZ4115627.1 STAS-like domain-containing protein [Xanthomonadaceae bacterium]MDZ4378933.1 STAS-like domain-containing protein [Xanthomonadaceae bacterium]
MNEIIISIRGDQPDQARVLARAEAKRLLQRIERFRCVVLDFSGVTLIGQGFADEVFRVFANAHPAIVLSAVNAEEQVKAMIVRAGGQVQDDLFDSGTTQATLDLS